MILFQHKTRILLVCTENICRSPMAEGLLRHYVQQSELRDLVEINSAGTQASQAGSRPDQRAQKVMALRGINISRIKARRVVARDLVRSDFVFAMDESNLRDLWQLSLPEQHDKLSLLLSHHANQPLLEVPDPYFGSIESFERVFHILDEAMDDLVSYIQDCVL